MATAPSFAADAAAWADELAAQGYCIIRSATPAAAVAALHADLASDFERTPFCRGDFYGWRTRRFHGLLRRSAQATAFVLNPLILDIAGRILHPYCDNLQLNLTQALEIHPGELAQAPHRDQDMWQGPKGGIEYLINVMWPFTRYTAENGATLVWPGSHRGVEATQSDPVAAEMAPGDALLFLGSTLHGAGANRTTATRRGMIVSYCLGWLKPYENQWLTYPPEVARHFPPALAALVGYRQHRPNLGNFDGQCPSLLLQGPPPEHLAAVDELRPEQAAALQAFRARQLAAGDAKAAGRPRRKAGNG